MAAVIGVGLVGLGSAHMTQFAEHVTGGLLGAARVTHAVREDCEQAPQLDALGGIEWVDDVAQLTDAVDAAIVGGRDDSRRAEHALPLLEAGLPVLVDKPLANNRADAERLLDCGGRLLTASALRYHPGVREFGIVHEAGAAREVGAAHEAGAAREVGGRAPLVVAGNGDRRSPWSGLLFHGLHVVELAATVVCGDQPPVATGLRRLDRDRVAMGLGGRQVELHFRPERQDYQVGSTTFSLPPDYLAGVVRAFAPLAHGGPAPLSTDTMRAVLHLVFDVIDLLEAA